MPTVSRPEARQSLCTAQARRGRLFPYSTIRWFQVAPLPEPLPPSDLLIKGSGPLIHLSWAEEPIEDRWRLLVQTDELDRWRVILEYFGVRDTSTAN